MNNGTPAAVYKLIPGLRCGWVFCGVAGKGKISKNFKTMENTNDASARLLEKAKGDLIADMKGRDIGAIIWDNATAGFPYQPEILHHSTKEPGKTRVAEIMGLYRYDGVLYLIEEGRAPIKFSDFWNPDTEAAPTVVTLTEDIAGKDLGDPEAVKGYTTQGTLEEWTAIADCYFQALNQD